MFRNKPWMLCGDFNEILDGEDHSNFLTSSVIVLGMRDFLEVVRYCSLTDLSFHGPRFTWCNKRVDDLICKRLDMMLVNDKWLDSFTNFYIVFESGGCSDHVRGMFKLEADKTRRKKPFNFSNILTSSPKLHSIVADYWNTTPPLFVSTSALFQLSKN